MLTMRLFGRVRRTQGLQRINWLFLTGFVGGAMIWTTHFVAMLGYETPVIDGYDPTLTLVSLLLSIAATMVGFGIAGLNQRSALIEAGGVIVGLGVIVMHYTGVAAYRAAGEIQWDRSYVLASMIFAVVFGGLATNRIARPVSKFSKYGGTAALILTVVLTHFTGMSGMTIVPNPILATATDGISSNVMTALVCSIMLVILMLGASTYVIDLQSQRAAVERYRHLSLHDPLTGLPNRAAFNEHLTGLIARADEIKCQLAVLCFDLDRFKEINDLHGHSAGDAVLRTVAERLGAVLQRGEFVARVGGDEFVAVLFDYYVHSDVRAMAERVLDEICKPIEWNDHVLVVGSSVGVSTYPRDADNMDDVLSQADVAMYRAKATATNTICFYDPSMDQAARERNALAIEMRDGLGKGEFELFYQQQNDTVTRKIIGFEALLRWRHPARGMILPAEFIPIAEKTGFIMELGEWVLRTACVEAAGWKQPLRIAVNVAPQQLGDNRLPQVVQQILLETGLAASRLELEITESSIIENHQHALHAIRQLKKLGVMVAMDDFGTGYSSLSTLQSFPFDKIKIDRAFIDGVVSSKQSAAIVRSTLILAASLDIPVLAEGVEREEHMNFLQGEGCLQVQGFLFGKPMPKQAIEAIVNSETDDAALTIPPLSSDAAAAA